jgi:hypothetical protein
MTKTERLAENIVRTILLDVTDRRGWRQEWDGFDRDIQREIKATWKALILKELAKE